MPGWDSKKFSVRHRERGDVDAEDCFVLVPPRDPAAVAAIRAYARVTPDVLLAAELAAWADTIEGIDSQEVSASLAQRIRVWTGVLAGQVRARSMTIETALQRIAGHAADAQRRQDDSDR